MEEERTKAHGGCDVDSEGESKDEFQAYRDQWVVDLPGSGWGMCSSVPPSPISCPGRRSYHALVSEQKADQSLQPGPGILL